MSDDRWKIRNSAPLGSPQNPEIIEPGGFQPRNEREAFEPGARPQGPRAPGRVRRSLQILMWMLYVSAPAFFIDSIWFWLFDMGTGDGGIFAWILLFLVTLPALLLTLFAMVANSFLLLVFFASLLGKPISEHPMGFVRFIKIGR
ncbi:MAG: hypothetical protein KF799_14610 [Bdellovibrionales bacterium]|nr:hypothetical protein [Bdellovibrionales bacterium]